MKILKPIKFSFLFKSLAVILGTTALYFIIESSSQNRVDDFWITLDTILATNDIKPSNNFKATEQSIRLHNIPRVTDSLEVLKKIYFDLQNNNPDCEPFDNIIKKPFLLMDDFNKFKDFLTIFLNKKKLVLEGISGSGKSTLIDRVSRMISGHTENVLKLDCVEKLEVEYHKEFVGYKDRDGFHPGKLLKFLEKAKSEPTHKFIFIIDDIDKVYSATVFGSILWKEMDNSTYDSYIDGYPFEISFPDNFFLLSITHSDVGNIIEMTSEHFRRLGDVYRLGTNLNVFILQLQDKIKKENLNYTHIKKLCYLFKKANEYIANRYGTGYTLGQWSNLRKKTKPKDFDEFVDEFIHNVNAFKPQKELKRDDFDDIFYAIDNNGKVPGTSNLGYLYAGMVATGLFSEVSVAISAALLSGLIGFFVYRKRKKIIDGINQKLIDTQLQFENKVINFDESMSQIIKEKEHLKELTKTGKIKYEEFTFFTIFIEDIIKNLEARHKSTSITEGFEDTFAEFMEDGVLDENEYNILIKFLEKMRNTIPAEIYYSLKNRIDEIKKKSD